MSVNKINKVGNKIRLYLNQVTSNTDINHRGISFQKQLRDDMINSLPFYASGKIVPGFGRGSKELGIPTANFDLEVVKSLPPALNTGIYYGWANIDNGDVHKMVLSIGWNPFYENKEKSMETHILHPYNRDLYGCLLKICIVGYLRAEQNFNSLDELVAQIKADIAQADELLDADTEKNIIKEAPFFKSCICDNGNNNEQQPK